MLERRRSLPGLRVDTTDRLMLRFSRACAHDSRPRVVRRIKKQPSYSRLYAREERSSAGLKTTNHARKSPTLNPHIAVALANGMLGKEALLVAGVSESDRAPSGFQQLSTHSVAGLT
jgi:hypothetical protein